MAVSLLFLWMKYDKMNNIIYMVLPI